MDSKLDPKCCKCGTDNSWPNGGCHKTCRACSRNLVICQRESGQLPAVTESLTAASIEARAPIGTAGYRSQTLSQQPQGPRLLPLPPLASLHPSASSSNRPTSIQPAEPEDCPACGGKESGLEYECPRCKEFKSVIEKGKKHICVSGLDKSRKYPPQRHRTKRISEGMTKAEIDRILQERRDRYNFTRRDRNSMTDAERYAKAEAIREYHKDKKMRDEAEAEGRRRKAKEKADRDFEERLKQFNEGNAADNKAPGKTMSQGPSQVHAPTIPYSQLQITYGQGYTAQVPPPLTQPMGAPLAPVPHPPATQSAALGASSRRLFDPVRDANESQNTGSGTAGTTWQDPDAGSSQKPKATGKRKSGKKHGAATKKPKK